MVLLLQCIAKTEPEGGKSSVRKILAEQNSTNSELGTEEWNMVSKNADT